MTPSGAPGRTVPGPPNPVFVRRHAAEPTSVRTIRREVDAWLVELDWPDDDRDDVVLAVGEAVTNAVEHAYAGGATGDVTVVGRLRVEPRRRQVVVVVRDRGSWRPPPSDPGYRGHGFGVMDGCTEHVDVHRGSAGTTVTMTSCPVPLPARAGLRRPGLRHSALTARPAADHRTTERHDRNAGILRRAEALRAHALVLAGDVDAARLRSSDIGRTSAFLVARARRLLAEQRSRRAA